MSVLTSCVLVKAEQHKALQGGQILGIVCFLLLMLVVDVWQENVVAEVLIKVVGVLQHHKQYSGKFSGGVSHCSVKSGTWGCMCACVYMCAVFVLVWCGGVPPYGSQ